jgi:tetratricopeptide (TPR) repeat protein
VRSTPTATWLVSTTCARTTASSVNLLHNALEIAQQIGYTRVIGGMIGNLGAIYTERGMIDEALACYRHALRVALELGDWYGVSYALAQMAEVNRGAGMLNDGGLLAVRAVPLAEQMQALYFLADGLLVQAEALLNDGNAAEARTTAERALATAQQVNNTDTAFNTGLLLVRIRQVQGELDSAGAAAAYNALRETYPDDAQQAALDYAIWQLDPSSEAMRHSAAERYRTIYETATKAQYRERYTELTGENLPEPEPLPDLPQAVRLNGAPMESLLALVDARLA